MSLSAGSVGIAPGTTTISIGQGGSISLVGAQQDPGTAVRNAYGELKGLGSFDAKPTDFDLSKIYGYMPVHRGWMVGKLDGAGLGEESPLSALGPALSSEQTKQIAQMVMSQLVLEEKSLELKERRSRRFWGAVAGLAAATTAVVGVYVAIKR